MIHVIFCSGADNRGISVQGTLGYILYQKRLCLGCTESDRDFLPLTERLRDNGCILIGFCWYKWKCFRCDYLMAITKRRGI